MGLQADGKRSLRTRLLGVLGFAALALGVIGLVLYLARDHPALRQWIQEKYGLKVKTIDDLKKTNAAYRKVMEDYVTELNTALASEGAARLDEVLPALAIEQIYVKIVSLDSWGMSVSGCKNCARDVFYAWLIPPEIAQGEMARDRSGI